MTIKKLSLAIGGFALAAACTTVPAPPDTDDLAELNACVAKAMKLGKGTFTYTGVNAGVSGGHAPFVTTSDHKQRPDGIWEFSTYGGDMGEEISTILV